MGGQLGPGFIDCAMEFRRVGDSDPYVCTMAFEVDTPPFTQAHADALSLEFRTNFASLLPNDCTMGPMTTRVGQDGDPVILLSSATSVGTNSSDFLPQNCALLLQKRSEVGGRRNRGRMYIPGVPETACNEVGVLTTTYTNAVKGLCDTFAAEYQDPAEFNTSAMVILHSTGDPTPTEVTLLTVDERIATQRRRLR